MKPAACVMRTLAPNIILDPGIAANRSDSIPYRSGAVLHYDAWIPNLALYAQTSSPSTSSPAPNTTSAQVQAGTIQYLCGTVQSLCTGSNTQYNSTQSCINILTTKEYGNWDEVWMDSVICRTLHILLARADPKVRLPISPLFDLRCCISTCSRN